MTQQARALFLDRDGILDELVFFEDSGEFEAPRSVSEVRMIPGVAGPLRRIAAAGWLLVVVTNQPGYAKGKADRESLLAVHREIVEWLDSQQVPIAGSYVCLHHPDGIVPEVSVRCSCRKPGTGSLERAASELGIDLRASWMAGDQDSDLLCGRAAGCRVALIEHHGSAAKRGEVEPDVRCSDLAALAAILVPRS